MQYLYSSHFLIHCCLRTAIKRVHLVLSVKLTSVHWHGFKASTSPSKENSFSLFFSLILLLVAHTPFSHFSKLYLNGYRVCNISTKSYFMLSLLMSLLKYTAVCPAIMS